MPSPSVAELALAVQSAKGTPATHSTHRSYLSGGSLPGPVKNPAADTATTSTRIASGPVVTDVPVLGDPEVFIRPGLIGALLYGVLGAKSVSGSSDPYTHVFTLGTSLPYFTTWRSLAGVLNERSVDVRIARLTIVGRARQPLRAGVSFIGGAGAHRTAQETAAAVETADTLYYYHGKGALKVEGVAVSSIRDFTLTIEAGVALIPTLAGPLPMLNGQLSIELAATQILTDAALWKRMLYGSSSPADLAAPTLTPLELAGSPAGIEFMFTEQASPERSLKIAIPRVAVGPIDGWGGVATDYGPMVHGVHYRAYAPASGSPITATLKNGQAEYAPPILFAALMATTANVEGWWRVGEASGGSAADASGLGRTGSYGNAPTLGVAGALAGDSDTAMGCPNGAYSSLNIPTSVPMPGSGSYTAAVWIYRSAAGVVQGIWTFGDRYYGAAWNMWIDSLDRVVFLVNDGAGNEVTLVSSLTLPATATWYRVALVIDRAANLLRIYVDGVADSNTASIAAVGAINPPTTWRVLGWSVYGGPGNPLYGRLDEPAILSRAVPAAEEAALNLAGR